MDDIWQQGVAKAFQARGIGRGLFKGAISIYRSRNPELTKLSVHSSPNSVGAYRKFGFQETAPEQVMNGIRFTPMIIHPSEKLQT